MDKKRADSASISARPSPEQGQAAEGRGPRRRVVITGIGVVAPNGIGKDEFWNHCFAGVSGIKPITLFDVSKYRCRYAGEISNFAPEKYLGPKGLRNLDRTTLLSLVAAKMAIDDAKLDITDENRNDIGVVLGSTMGSVHSISEFDKEGLREGPRYVNPAQFPNTVINSPASQVAIRFGLRGLNATISTGFTASLDAINYARDMLILNRAKVLLVGGVEELCIQTFLGFYKLGFLATAQNGTPPPYAPFGSQRCGTLLGEGGVFFMCERAEEAQRRGAHVYGELLGYGTQFNSDSLYRNDPEAKSAVAAIQQALREAGAAPLEIDWVSSSANSSKACDGMEEKAHEAVFGSGAGVAIGTPKAMVGEAFSAAGALQVAIAIGSLELQQMLMTIDSPQHLGSKRHRDINRVLVTSVGLTGVSSALVLGRR